MLVQYTVTVAVDDKGWNALMEDLDVDDKVRTDLVAAVARFDKDEAPLVQSDGWRDREKRMDKQLFVVQPPIGNESNIKVVLWASDRDAAGRAAQSGWLAGYGRAHEFVITPITSPGDRVKLDITLNT